MHGLNPNNTRKRKRKSDLPDLDAIASQDMMNFDIDNASDNEYADIDQEEV